MSTINNVKVINSFYDLDIDPRGDLTDYFKKLKYLHVGYINLKTEVLIQACKRDKIKQIDQKIEFLINEMYD